MKDQIVFNHETQTGKTDVVVRTRTGGMTLRRKIGAIQNMFDGTWSPTMGVTRFFGYDEEEFSFTSRKGAMDAVREWAAQ